VSLWASHPCISIPRDELSPAVPWVPTDIPVPGGLEPIVAPLLRPSHPVLWGRRPPWPCLSLAAPACSALCSVPDPGMVAGSFGREKGSQLALGAP